MFFKKSKVQKKILLARAIHREHFLLQCLKKEIPTPKELDLRPLGKVIIFCYRTFLLYIDDPIIHVATTWQQLHLYYKIAQQHQNP